MENRAHALAAGIFVVLVGALALGAVVWFGGKDEVMRDLVVVTRGNVSGLNPQAQVRYRGIKVGKVLDLGLDPADPRDILINIRVNESVPLTQGTTARLGYQGVTGLAHVLLEESGKDPAPLLSAGKLPPRITMQASLLDELGDSGAKVLRQAQEFLSRANALLDEGNRRRLGDTLGNVETATRQLAAASAALPETLARVNRLLGDDNLRRLERTLEGSGRVAGAAEGALGEWRQVAGELQRVSRTVEQAVGGPGGDGIAGVAPRLNELAGELGATSQQLNRLLRNLEAAPQSLIFGAPSATPGPGEAGFVVPERKSP